MRLLQYTFGLTVIIAAIAEARWIARKSMTLVAIAGLGLALRLGAGITLFAISYFDLDLLTPLHTGGGFWAVALDSPMYYASAADAAAGNLFHTFAHTSSPVYVTALALWFRATGTSVLNGILFNSACYLVTAAVIVAEPAGANAARRWSPAVLAAFSCSPVLLLTSTQVLKDPFFITLVVILCRVALEIFDRTPRPSWRHPGIRPAAIGVAALVLGLISGTRAYYAAFAWLAFAGGVTLWLVASPRVRMKRAHVAAAGVTTLAILWGAFVLGAGSSYHEYLDGIRALGLAGEVQSRRNAFVGAGGATNIAAPVEVPAAPAPTAIPSVAGDYGIFLIDYDSNVPRSAPVTPADLPAALFTLGSRPVKNAYFVENTGDPEIASWDINRYATVSLVLRRSNFDVANISLAGGRAVPSDAALVIVAGRTAAVSATARTAIRAFLERGGTLLKIVEAPRPVDRLDAVSAPVPAEHPARHVVNGLLAIFVPASILKASSLLTFQGGRGMLWVADVDTLFFDATLVLFALMLVRRRAALDINWPAAVFILTLATVSTVLLAYVVTNLGTLFRLRLLIAAPAWIAPFATSDVNPSRASFGSGSSARPSP